MHDRFDMSHAFWNFLILFTFAWVVLYISEPNWVKREGLVSKSLCAWYALAIAILIVLVILVIYGIMFMVHKRKVTQKADSFLERMGFKHDDAVALREKAVETYKETPGEKPIDKMRTMLDSLKKDAEKAMSSARTNVPVPATSMLLVPDL